MSIIRSFDAKALDHHPENVIAYGKALHDHEVVALDGLPGVPVHRLKTEPSGAPLTAFYVIWWNGTFVDSPYSFRTSDGDVAAPRQDPPRPTPLCSEQVA